MKGSLLCMLLLLLTCCTDDLRDLHDTTGVVLEIEGSWIHSLGETHRQDATALLHHSGGNHVKAHFSRPNGVTPRVSKGDYDVLIFNGVMESEQTTNLDHVHFRGTDRLTTFEAYAAEARPLARLPKAEDEYIASNNMELFTFAHHRVTIDEDSGLYIRYANGVRTDDGKQIIADTIESAPRAMSYRFQVRISNIVNPKSARSAVGAFRGFLGSVYMPASGDHPRPGLRATHHLALSQPSGSRIGTRADGEETGMLVSPWFVTFGPPLPPTDDEDLPASGQYFFEPVFLLTDGTEYAPGPIDITDQVNGTIRRMLEHHGDGEDISHEDNLFEIIIDEGISLPIVSGGGGGVGGPIIDVDPWEDEEIIIIWV